MTDIEAQLRSQLADAQKVAQDEDAEATKALWHCFTTTGREVFSLSQVQDGDVATFSRELVEMGLPPLAIMKRVT